MKKKKKKDKVPLVVVRVLLLLLAVLLHKMCTKTRKSVLFVVSKSHRTVVWLWVQVTMVTRDFRDARMQLSLCCPWLLFTFTTDGHANQTVISVCLLPHALPTYTSLNVAYHISFWDKCQGHHRHTTQLLPCDTCCHVSHCYCAPAVQTVAASPVCGTSRAVMVPQQHFVALLQQWNHSCDYNIQTYCATGCQFAPFKPLYSQCARTCLLLGCVETGYLTILITHTHTYIHTTYIQEIHVNVRQWTVEVN